LSRESTSSFWSNSAERKKSIIESIQKVYGDDAPSPQTICRWISKFEAGRDEVEDDPHSGRPSSSTNDEKIIAVRELVEEDRRISVQAIAEALEISVGSVETILHDHLGLSKLSVRRVPKALRDEQKARRAECAIDFLNRFENRPCQLSFSTCDRR